jgi:aminomethyltransferase
MKETPFYQHHIQLGAKVVPFAGYQMPIQYSGIIDEHRKVRNAVGVFDVSHMGEFLVSGKNALQFLQRVTINDVSRLSPGRAQYSAMCYDSGGIVDDLLVYQLGPDRYMTVVNASNIEKDLSWMKEHLINGVELVNQSDETALLAIQGPKAEETLQKLTPVALSGIQYYHFAIGTVCGIEMIISRTGYTGERGFEIYFAPGHADLIWNAVMDAGRPFGIAPIGLGARDTLRLEMGFCLYGNDIDQTTNPLEAGLGWITKMSKPDFIGKPVLDRVKAEGLKRKLVGLIMGEKAVARHGYKILKDGSEVGVVTSGSFAPSLEKNIGMGYVLAPLAVEGKVLTVDVRSTQKSATIVSIPFLKK